MATTGWRLPIHPIRAIAVRAPPFTLRPQPLFEGAIRPSQSCAWCPSRLGAHKLDVYEARTRRMAFEVQAEGVEVRPSMHAGLCGFLPRRAKTKRLIVLRILGESRRC